MYIFQIAHNYPLPFEFMTAIFGLSYTLPFNKIPTFLILYVKNLSWIKSKLCFVVARDSTFSEFIEVADFPENILWSLEIM